MTTPRTISTDAIRAMLCNPEERADFDLIEATQQLIGVCDALDEEPEAYGFEFVVDDQCIGNEGTREHYYAWKFAAEHCPDAFTSRIYILGRERNPDDEGGGEITSYEARIYDYTGELMEDSREGEEYFSTCAEAVAWLADQLGWGIPKVAP